MKLSRLVTWVTFIAIFAMATHVSIDSDTWWHLKAGEWMVEQRAIITADPFSFTRGGTPWQYPGLWVQVFMYELFANLGYGGLNLWVSLMVVLIFGLVWQTTTGSPITRSLLLILAAAASSIYWAARPYLFTYLFAALFMLLLVQYQRGDKKNLYVLPVLMVLWVNSHGGYLAGFLFVAPFLVESGAEWWLAVRQKDAEAQAEYRKKFIHLTLIFVLLFAATLLNPQGFEMWKLPFTTVSRQAEQLFIAEWQSPNFHDSTIFPFAILFILTLGVLGLSEKQVSISEVLLLCGFGLLSLYSVRNIFFFVIAAPAVLSRQITALLEGLGDLASVQLKLDFNASPNKLQKIMNVALVVVVGFVAFARVLLYLPYEANMAEVATVYPVSAVGFLEAEELSGNMFNSYNFGGYLIWALPKHPVFVDGRADLHQDEIIMTWYSAYNGLAGWEDVFADWDIGFVVVEPFAPIVQSLEWAGWELVYSDDVAVVYRNPVDVQVEP